MTAAMAHRGPDNEGVFHSGQICLAHRRLSIIDLSDAANCPFTDASGRYVLVFNGELYNYREVKSQLPDYPFETSGDTEVLAAAFAKWGPECVNRFKGMFAFAVWDKNEEKLTVCRDRMGVKPIYYFFGDQFFVFASEVRAIIASGLVQARLDKQALVDYFSFQSFGYPSSAIEGVNQVEAGSYLTVCRGKMEKSVYWQVGSQDTSIDFSDPNKVRGNVKRLLSEAVERRLVSDVPIGAFLSGGIDSSAIVGLMAEVSTEQPVTFNISFAEREFDESVHAELVAKKFRTKHHKIILKPSSFLEELENALGAMDTPSADGINTYVVSKAIRTAGITVALSGVGGDELFAGYPFFQRFSRLQGYRRYFRMTQAIRPIIAGILLSNGSGRTQRIGSLLAAPDLSIAALYPEFRRILTPGQLRMLTKLDTEEKTLLEKELRKHSGKIDQLPILSQVSAAEYLGYTQNTLLKDTDQMSMAVSLEVREPFFDHNLVEYLLQVPDNIKFPVYPKSLLVESLKPLLPDEIVHRKKQGFLFPWELWMKNELRSFCEKHINRLSEREFINATSLKLHWNRFLAGDKGIRWTELWLFIVLSYWMEKNQVED
jgi:asparagine synthase (glutamine-hydrolysing)